MPAINREEWLNRAVKALRPIFKAKGYTIPKKVRVSIGFPDHNARQVVGECFDPSVSEDGHAEIFISPVHKKPVEILATLVHELLHAAVGIEHHHDRTFHKACKAMDLEGKPTATFGGKAFNAWAIPLLKKLPKLQHARLKAGARKSKQGTRMLKVICSECGYTLRTTRQWLDVGLPTCCCGTEMEEA